MMSWPKRKPEATRSSPPRSLSERYQKDAKSLLLVDTRQEWEYRTGHLKGAVNFPMEPTCVVEMAQGIGARNLPGAG